jgi:tryptophanyl-tRNA synthetase
MRRALVVAVAVVLASCTCAQAQNEPDLIRTTEKTMKELLAGGFEVRSHQFFRCTNNPAKDDALSCVSVIMQKGAAIATCAFDRDRFLFVSQPMNARCTVFE